MVHVPAIRSDTTTPVGTSAATEGAGSHHWIAWSDWNNGRTCGLTWACRACGAMLRALGEDTPVAGPFDAPCDALPRSAGAQRIVSVLADLGAR